MRQMLPQIIIDNFENGVLNGEIQATALFVDISGFSSIADILMQHGQHGAEILSGMMRQIFDLLSDHITSQGGFIVGFAGDAVTALFPFGENQLLSMRRALTATIGFQQDMAKRPTIQTIYGSFPVSAKAGLAQGCTQWGILLSKNNEKATFYFRGDSIDDSAAAEHFALAGEIVITAALFKMLAGELSGEPRADFFVISENNFEFPARLPFSLREPERSILRIFFPDILLETHFANEFRQVVNLFIQLQDIDQTQITALMSDLFELQTRYGGLLNRIDFGDKGCNLLLFWGAPVAYENDVIRALHFILELRDTSKQPFKAGLTYYVACAGFIGSYHREEYTCYGRGVSLAARLMTSADFGEIWVDEKVETRARRHFNLGFIGEREFKGFSRREKVFLLLEPRTSFEISYNGKINGRETELAELNDFMIPLWKQKFAGTLMVRGDAGIGKSRLIKEFRSSLLFDQHSTTWAMCQSDEFLRQPFDPFRYWLRQYFDLSTVVDASQKLDKFKARFQLIIDATQDNEILFELKRTESFIAALVGVYWADSLYNQLDAQARYDNTFIALCMLIKAECLRQPLILLLEDAHFIDADSLSFLSYLKRILTIGPRTFPLAILLTSRKLSVNSPENNFQIDQIIDLGMISPKDLSVMVETILGGPPTPGLLTLLQDRSDGNPFFVEQLLSYLNEEKLLFLNGDFWDISQQGKNLSLPTDLHALLVARLDQLTRAVRELIQTASILGREFDVKVLSNMLKDNSELPGLLIETESAAIWTTTNQIRYIFRHSLLRDAAYTMQMQARRKELHAIAFHALESVYTADLKHHTAELAYHAEQAGLIEKARKYLELTGNSLMEAYQNALAVEYYTHALELTPEDDLTASFFLLIGREKALSYLGNKERQQRDIEVLLKISRQLDEEKQIRVDLRYVKFEIYIGNYSAAAPIIRSLISRTHSPERIEFAIQAYTQQAVSLYRQGKLESAIRINKRGLILAQKAGNLQAEAKLLNTLGLIYFEQKNLEKAKSHFETCLRISIEINSLGIQARSLNNLGMLFGSYGDLNTAHNYYLRSLDLAREMGDRKGESIVLSNLGWISGVLGDYEMAISYAHQTLKNVQETGDRFTEAYSLINLSAQTGARGNYESALSYARQALDITKNIGDPSGEAWSFTYIGHELLASGFSVEASEAYQSALAIRKTLNQPALATEPAAGLARASLMRGDPRAAKDLVDQIINFLDSGGSLDGTDEPLRLLLNCHYVLKSLDHARSAEFLKNAFDTLQARAAQINNENARGKFFEDVPVNREILRAWHKYTNLVE